MNTRLYVLTCGIIWVERGFLWHFGTKENSGKDYEPEPFKIRNCQFFIDHPDAKVLVDCGFTGEMWSKFPGFPERTGPEGVHFKQEPDENIKSQLEKIGVGCSREPDTIRSSWTTFPLSTTRNINSGIFTRT